MGEDELYQRIQQIIGHSVNTQSTLSLHSFKTYQMQMPNIS